MNTINSTNLTVAVLILTYNQEEYVRQAIESVISQQGDFSFCLFIGDDCSTDGTSAICMELQEKYPDKIRLHVNEQNLGSAGNLKKVLRSCYESGAKYVAVCEGDDYWTDTSKLQTQVNFMERNPDYSICFHKIHISENGKLIEDYLTKRLEKDTIVQEDLIVAGNVIHTPSVLFRNKIGKLPDWHTSIMPCDYLLWVSLTNGGEKIKYIDRAMAVYRVHDAGEWSSQPIEMRNQKFGIACLFLMRELDIRNEYRIKEYMVRIADGVYQFGFDLISKNGYFSLLNWSRKTVDFTFTQTLFFYTANIRREFLKPITAMYKKNMR